MGLKSGRMLETGSRATKNQRSEKPSGSPRAARTSASAASATKPSQERTTRALQRSKSSGARSERGGPHGLGPGFAAAEGELPERRERGHRHRHLLGQEGGGEQRPARAEPRPLEGGRRAPRAQVEQKGQEREERGQHVRAEADEV